MKVHIKLTGALHTEILRDLKRPHPFAAERVGFVFGRRGTLAGEQCLIVLTRYHSIPDDQYLEDHAVGARIGSEALTSAMQAVYLGRPAREGIFHIHMHCHSGEPIPQLREIENLLIESFDMLGGQLRDFATGRTTYPAFLEDIGKLRETKADPYGAPNHLYANDRLRRIEAVSALASHWSW